MIYTETIRYIRCDRCGAITLKTHAANDDIARETAKRKGWLVTYEGDWIKERHYCPVCKKAL